MVVLGSFIDCSEPFSGQIYSVPPCRSPFESITPGPFRLLLQVVVHLAAVEDLYPVTIRSMFRPTVAFLMHVSFRR